MSTERDRLLSLVRGDFEVARGHPLPLGAHVRRGGINFSVFSAHATAVTLVLFAPGGEESLLEWPLDPRYNRTGDVWHVFIGGLDPGVEYAFRAERAPNPRPAVHRFDRGQLLLEPYARAVAGAATWGDGSGALADVRPGGGAPYIRPRRARLVEEEFDWGYDQPINRHLADSVVYEMHVRGFTVHPSSGVAHPGTYLGVIEKIPYLKELGVTAVELLPVTEFEENDNERVDPLTGARLKNYWGYQPLAFFAPKAGYAASRERGAEVREFKQMVKALHAAGIEVILDMVFNHSGEGDERGPTLSFRGLDNATYYLIDPASGRYLDFTGCGNTLNCNHPVVRGLIVEALEYWVTEMHVDGFRFDLASVLGRGRDGSVLANPPLLERIAANPVLASTKLIAEAWDAAGLYQVGTFPHFGRWAEWNGRFRDDVRRFVRGEPGAVGALATRLAGSSDLYEGSGRAPFHSVNFVTSHDGFTLRDLVSYERKHNERNGEGNRDGHDHNLSWNCGVEGPSDEPRIEALRRRQQRNLLAILLLSQGVPMLLAGDELGRSQGGNNNAYCQDNATSWLDWSLRESNADLFRFAATLVRFRQLHPQLRRRGFQEDVAGRPWVVWQGPRPGAADWSPEARFLGAHFAAAGDDDVFLALNSRDEPVACELPPPASGRRWHLFLDTCREPPGEIHEPGREPELPSARACTVGPRSVVCLVGR